MECPFCTTSLPDEDLFCEACGKPLQAPSPTITCATACCSCGAPAEEIDEDGYCGRCGYLAHRRPTDHIEILQSDDFAGVSDRGIKHQRNEDRFALRQVGVGPDAGYVLVVCDGVSSSTQSEQASSFVADRVAELLEASLRRHSASSPERTVRTAILDAQSKLATAASEPSPGDPSTTVVAALVTGQNAAVGWAGDSRAYWIGEDGEAKQLTSDHSWMNEVVAAGQMTLEEASQSPQAHGITRWLGSDAGDNAQPDVTHFTIPGPGHLLLCTDGLWNYAQEPGQIAALLEGDAALDKARHMVDYAIQQGGHDNITAILLRSSPLTCSESEAPCDPAQSE